MSQLVMSISNIAAMPQDITVKRSDVAPDFTFLVPVRVEFEGGKSGYLFVNVKDNEQTITKDLPMAPRNVVFAPDFSLLANIKKE